MNKNKEELEQARLELELEKEQTERKLDQLILGLDFTKLDATINDIGEELRASASEVEDLQDEIMYLEEQLAKVETDLIELLEGDK